MAPAPIAAPAPAISCRKSRLVTSRMAVVDRGRGRRISHHSPRVPGRPTGAVMTDEPQRPGARHTAARAAAAPTVSGAAHLEAALPLQHAGGHGLPRAAASGTSPDDRKSTAPSTATKHCRPARAWFEALRDRLCAAFEAIEDAGDDRRWPAARPLRTHRLAPTDDGGRRRRRDERDARPGVREGGGERLHRLGRIQPGVPRPDPRRRRRIRGSGPAASAWSRICAARGCRRRISTRGCW